MGRLSNMQDPLQQLRDLHLPPEPAWFPPAPGWWLLALAGLVVAVGTAVRAARRRRRRLPFRRARTELEALRTAIDQGRLSPPGHADAVNALLKRVVIHALRRTDAAPLSGDEWLAFLDGLSGARVFTDGAGRVLGDARFAPGFHADVAALHEQIVRLFERLERAA